MTRANEDLGRLKARLHDTWTAGDYAAIAEGMRDSAARFARRHRRPGDRRVLDVACGAGQVALPLAEDGGEVTGVDIAENLVETARARAAATGLAARFDVGDVEALPYPDAHFDLVVSLIGAMFAPRPDRAAAEMARVCRPGGRIVMGNWAPEGFVGRFFRTLAAHAPPPDMPSPLLWGDPQVVRGRFEGLAEDVAITRGALLFSYGIPPDRLVPHYMEHFGPLVTAGETLDAAGRAALEADLVALWSEANRSGDGGTVVEGEILEVVARRA